MMLPSAKEETRHWGRMVAVRWAMRPSRASTKPSSCKPELAMADGGRCCLYLRAR